LHEYSRESLGFLVNEAILTHTHWSIQSVHDRCVALAECGQTPHLPPARRSSTQPLTLCSSPFEVV
jgi:hypothetical protein